MTSLPKVGKCFGVAETGSLFTSSSQQTKMRVREQNLLIVDQHDKKQSVQLKRKHYFICLIRKPVIYSVILPQNIAGTSFSGTLIKTFFFFLRTTFNAQGFDGGECICSYISRQSQMQPVINSI